METLKRVARHNGWANQIVFELVGGADAAVLGAEAKGTRDTIEGTLKHLVGVEDAYLAMLREQDLAATLGSQGAYNAHDLAWFASRSARLADEYRTLLDGADEPFLTTQLRVPWFKTPIDR